MKILATADSHFGFLYGRTSESRMISTERMFQAFENVVDFAIRNGVDLFLHGGDMFNRSRPRKKIISKGYELITKLTDQEIPFVGIPGNHDRSSLPETLLSHFDDHLYFLNKTSCVKIDSISVIGFPFIARHPKYVFREVARKANLTPEETFIVLCHQLFDGAVFGPHQHIFTNRSDTLDTSILPNNVKLVISGHIHRAQSLQNGRIFYTGSLERTSFMEIIEPKGFLLIELDKVSPNIEFVETESSPMAVIELEIGESESLSPQLDSIEVEANVKTLIRIVGRKLSPNEIKFLWAKFPAKEFPYLTFSPKKHDIKLKSLYRDTNIPFNLRKFIST